MNAWADGRLEWMDLQGGKSRLHTEAERGSGMANDVCSAMMLRQHQSVPSAEGDVAENGHVFVLYRLETRPRANSTRCADKQGRCWAVRGM